MLTGKDIIRDHHLAAWANGFGSRLECLKLPLNRDAHAITDDGLLALIKKSPQLRYLKLRSAMFTDRSLHEIPASCPLLRELELGSNNVTAIGAKAVIDGCSQLKCLQLWRLSTINWFPEKLFTGKCKK